MNESQTKINCYFYHRNKIYNFFDMRQKRFMNNTIFQKHELHEIFRNRIQSNIYREEY